ncbi:cyclophilin [Neocallimastix lanati (nom. inval.)]|jgi:cyclophilin family peptidyl-prolyl cis-trans isomerase|nr:cyclophilin [Neocallimastix sp. JGI-2020a]
MPPKSKSNENLCSKVFLDFDIGSIENYENEKKAYALAKDFIKENSSIYGWPENITELDEQQQELAKSIFDTNPVWNSKGSIQFNEPKSIRHRIVFELYPSATPKTCKNFTTIIEGTYVSKKINKAITYKQVPMHRIVKDFIAQGGDVTRFDGSGGDSIYNGKFNDEKEGLKIAIDQKGLLVMANSGKNTNTSQFFITLNDDASKYKKITGKHVVFGKCIEGMEIIDKINECGSSDGTPSNSVIIGDCGLMK